MLGAFAMMPVLPGETNELARAGLTVDFRRHNTPASLGNGPILRQARAPDG